MAKGAAAFGIRNAYKDVGSKIGDTHFFAAVTPLPYFSVGGGKGLNPQLL